MRISETVAPVGLFLVSLGLASALAFDDTRSPNDVAPAVSADVVPRTAMTGPTAMIGPVNGALTGPLDVATTPTEVATPPPSGAALGFGGMNSINNLKSPDAALKLTP